MKNFELALFRAKDRDSLIVAHQIMDGMFEDEYFDEAPSVDPNTVSATDFFIHLYGPTWEERLEEFNVEHEVGKIPKAYDVALAFAMGRGEGDPKFEKARQLLKELLEQGIAHRRAENCTEFFESFDEREELREQLAELEAEKQQQRFLDDLRGR